MRGRADQWAVVPIKSFVDAKHRLSSTLDDDARQALVRAMAEDVIAELKKVEGLQGVLVVTRSSEVRDFAIARGVEHWDDPPQADLSMALEATAEHLITTFAARTMMILPCDVPLAEAGLLSRALSRHRGLTLASDIAGAGTNLLIASPPNLIRFCYDGYGFQVHRERGRELGVDVQIIQDERLQLDIDTPDDLERMKRLAEGTEVRLGSQTLPLLRTAAHSRTGTGAQQIPQPDIHATRHSYRMNHP